MGTICRFFLSKDQIALSNLSKSRCRKGEAFGNDALLYATVRSEYFAPTKALLIPGTIR